MKRRLQLTICLILVTVLLCGCMFDLSPEAAPVAKEMMKALAAGNEETAMSLMHPNAQEQIRDMNQRIQTLIGFVDGRSVTEWKQTSVNVKNQVGTNSGKYEEGSFRATLDDGTVLRIEYEYLNNKAGEGFTSFYLSVGG